ncbi:MAG: tetratricopeptide repeat protein [Candidatus Eiseniibacteriota bacterium]
MLRKPNSTLAFAAAIALLAATSPAAADADSPAPTATPTPAPTMQSDPAAALKAAISKPELVPWIQDGDYASLLARAKKQKKLVFLDVYATWCGPCKQMDKFTYSDSTVAEVASKYYLSRKVDGEKGEGIGIAQRFNVNSYPTLLIVDGDGKEQNRAVGFRQAKQFAKILDDTRSGRGTIAGLEKMIAGGKDTYENRIALAQKYVEAGELVKARENYDKAFALDPDDKNGQMADALYLLGRAERSQGNHQRAVDDFEKFLARFPNHGYAPDVEAQLAASLGELGRKDEAIATFKKVVARQPDDPRTLMAYARFCAGLGVAFVEATQAAQKAVEISNRSPQSLDVLADVYAAQGQWDEGLLALEEAARARPEDGALRGKMERFQEEAVRAVQARKR